MSKITRIILADDHELVRGAVADMLESQPDFEVVASVGDAQSAVVESLGLLPDILMLDIDMPGMVCFDAAREVHRQCPATRIVFLSAFLHDRYIEDALSAHASAYLAKGETAETLIHAIRAVASGGTYFSPDVLSRLVVDRGGLRLNRVSHSRGFSLTDREVEVLRYVARGLAKKEISGLMDLSVRTVDTHVRNIMDKLSIHDRVELARYAIREGLAEA